MATLRWRASACVIERDIALQYRIIAEGAGWAEKTDRGRLRFEGADRVSFLQALLTNEVASLRPGTGAYALYLTPQGRMIADLHVFVRNDSVIADVPAGTSLAATFDNLIFSEDVRVTDISSDVRQLTVAGARAAAILAAALKLEAEELARLDTWSHVEIPAGIIARTDDVPEGSLDVFVPATAASAVIAELEAAGAQRLADETVEALRIDAGRPKFGVDMTTETIPLEAGLLDRAISQTKGCYVGQEVIIRVLHRGGGRVAKRLVRLSLSGQQDVPPPGAVITVDGQESGHVTSAALSPRVPGVVALGYVKREMAEEGKAVRVSWGGGEPGAPAASIDATISGMAG